MGWRSSRPIPGGEGRGRKQRTDSRGQRTDFRGQRVGGSSRSGLCPLKSVLWVWPLPRRSSEPPRRGDQGGQAAGRGDEGRDAHGGLGHELGGGELAAVDRAELAAGLGGQDRTGGDVV